MQHLVTQTELNWTSQHNFEISRSAQKTCLEIPHKLTQHWSENNFLKLREPGQPRRLVIPAPAYTGFSQTNPTPIDHISPTPAGKPILNFSFIGGRSDRTHSSIATVWFIIPKALRNVTRPFITTAWNQMNNIRWGRTLFYWLNYRRRIWGTSPHQLSVMVSRTYLCGH